jgi:hypothetical protein
LLHIFLCAGLTGQHLVLFSVKGSHKLPPTRLSPGDMVCVRTCNSQGEVGTSCMQGSVHNLGDDGCSITVALKCQRGDPTYSKLFGKTVRIDRIQALADAVTYEVTQLRTCFHISFVGDMFEHFVLENSTNNIWLHAMNPYGKYTKYYYLFQSQLFSQTIVIIILKIIRIALCTNCMMCIIP